MAGGVENHNIIYPFEDMPNSTILEDVEECICRAALDSSGRCQTFDSTMSDEYSLVPRNCQVGLVPRRYGGIVVCPFNIKRGCLGSGQGMCNLVTWSEKYKTHNRDKSMKAFKHDIGKQSHLPVVENTATLAWSWP